MPKLSLRSRDCQSREEKRERIPSFEEQNMRRITITKYDGTLGNSRRADAVEKGSIFGREERQRLARNNPEVNKEIVHP